MPRKKVSPRKRKARVNKGEMSPAVILILLLVFFMFLLFFLFRGNPSSQNAGVPVPQSLLPSLAAESNAGLYTIGITPVPESYSPKMCNVLTNDVVLVIDNSGSMKGSKLEQAKNAAKMFVMLIGTNPASRVSVVMFNRTATLLTPLTSNIATAATAIEKIPEGSNTCIQCGVVMASAQFTSNTSISSSSSADIKRSVVLLSDGKANHVDGKRSNNAKQAAQSAISTGFKQNSASYYTIAIGEDADESFMTKVAESTNGAAFSAASYDVLANTFATVATDICTNSQ